MGWVLERKENDSSLVGVLFVTCLCFVLLEASYTLLLYDELLEWSERPLREFLSYPMQSEWQRKEYLHLTIIQNFDRGKVSALLLEGSFVVVGGGGGWRGYLLPFLDFN